MLQLFGPDIWIADGPTVAAAAGFHYPTRMAVMRLNSGDLVLWSPVEFSEDLRRAMDKLGSVRFLVPPNSLHHTFLGQWQRAYPEAKVYAPPGLREKRKDIAFEADFTDAGIPAWTGQIDVVIVRGNRIVTEVVFFHRKSGTVIFTDLLQQFPAGWFAGWRSVIARLDLMQADEPTVPRKFRVAFIDRKAARETVGRILAWPATKVLIAHGTPVTVDGQAFLRRAFGWLIGR